MSITSSKTVAVVAGLILLGAVISIWRTTRSSSGEINASPFVGVGQMLAEEAAKAVHDQGRVVAIIAVAHQQPGPLHDEWEAFRRELQKHPAITLAATETVTPDRNDPQPDTDVCPIAAFKSLLERHGEVGAIVFLMGLPDWHWLQEKQAIPPPIASKILALDVKTLGLKRHYGQFFENGLLSALITRRRDNAAELAKPKTPREWFDKEYQIFTPQNYESMPQ